jgi:hypothetical protein
MITISVDQGRAEFPIPNGISFYTGQFPFFNLLANLGLKLGFLHQYKWRIRSAMKLKLLVIDYNKSSRLIPYIFTLSIHTSEPL